MSTDFELKYLFALKTTPHLFRKFVLIIEMTSTGNMGLMEFQPVVLQVSLLRIMSQLNNYNKKYKPENLAKLKTQKVIN